MGYVLPPKKRPPHLHGDTFALLDLEDTSAGRKGFVRRLDEIAATEAATEADLKTAPSKSSPRRSLSELFDRGSGCMAAGSSEKSVWKHFNLDNGAVARAARGDWGKVAIA